MSFTFINKKSPNEYYIHAICTNKHNDYEKNIKETKLPWAQYSFYCLLKQIKDSNKTVNIFNHAGSKSVSYYHKRFLFNLGKESCDQNNEVYEDSKLIDFDLLKGPSPNEKEKFTKLLENLPEGFETSSGYSMKICDSKFVELKNLEKYLLSKWNNVFPKKTRSRSRSRSLSLNRKIIV